MIIVDRTALPRLEGRELNGTLAGVPIVPACWAARGLEADREASGLGWSKSPLVLMLDLEEYPHRRFNPLTGEWVLVSPHRAKRPWQGQVEAAALPPSLAYDPDCYLCPGNERAGGARNPCYETTFVFDNDFPALVSNAPADEASSGDLLRAESVRGVCRVVCFSPRHDLTLGDMGAADVECVIEVWAEQCRELGARPDVRYVQVFENRGDMMGCSNPHPHCQLWASDSLPNEIAKELASQSAYFEQHKRPLLADYLAKERAAGERIVAENEEFVVAVPFWALWPFETVLLPRRPATRLEDLDAAQRVGLAGALRDVVRRYDRLFGVVFPYSMGFHQAPSDGEAHPEWTLHAHFYPPLLRSATVRKFMVGYEMLATPQRDITPEEAARRLREMDLA